MRSLTVIGEADRRSQARLEILRVALRSGHIRTVARAASRARIASVGLDRTEAERARFARHRFGRALRLARARRDAGSRASVVTVVAPVATTGRLARARPLIAAVTLALSSLIVLPARDTVPPSEEMREALLADFICDRVMKSSDSLAMSTPVAAPAPTYYGAWRSAVVSSGVDVARLQMRPIRYGFARLIGRVVDDASALPLDDACIEVAFGRVLRARTDASGIFRIDVPINHRVVDFSFARAGYVPARMSLGSWGTRNVNFLLDVRLNSR